MKNTTINAVFSYSDIFINNVSVILNNILKRFLTQTFILAMEKWDKVS